MRTTIKSYIEAAKARKENGEAGFSLVELIVVVVILGILAAVAIPIFAGIQDQAEKSAAEAAAANGASEAAVALSKTPQGTLPTKSGDYTLTFTPADPTAVDQICVVASKDGKDSTPKGPGC